MAEGRHESRKWTHMRASNRVQTTVTLNSGDVAELIEEGSLETEQVVIELTEPEANTLRELFD